MEGRANPLESLGASLRDAALELRTELATSARVLKCVASRRSQEPPTKNGRSLKSARIRGCVASRRREELPQIHQEKLAGTIVQTRSRTEEGRSHEQPVKLYEVAVKGLLRIKRPVNISSKLPAERQDGKWSDDEVPHYPSRYHIISDGTA